MAIIITHTSCPFPPWKRKRLMILPVQAIKKLFVTCQVLAFRPVTQERGLLPVGRILGRSGQIKEAWERS
ncbi:uncharacterized [Tachysurus ichikawai]